MMDEDEDLEKDLVILMFVEFEEIGNCFGGVIETGEDSGDEDNEEAGEEEQLSVSSPDSSEENAEQLVDSIMLCKDSNKSKWNIMSVAKMVLLIKSFKEVLT